MEINLPMRQDAISWKPHRVLYVAESDRECYLDALGSRAEIG